MKKKNRKRKSHNGSPKSEGAGSLLALLVMGVAIYWLFVRDEGPEFPETVEQQLKQIDHTEQNLTNLLKFLEQHRESLKHQEEIVAQLRSEHESLIPIVEADRAVVSAILAEEAKRQRRHIWIDRVIAFMLGLSSSILASYLWVRIRRKHSAVE